MIGDLAAASAHAVRAITEFMAWIQRWRLKRSPMTPPVGEPTIAGQPRGQSHQSQPQGVLGGRGEVDTQGHRLHPRAGRRDERGPRARLKLR